MAKRDLNDFVQMGQLFEVYGNLLSEDRRQIMAAYFAYNNTLAEIAKERNISRQAVLDAIDKSCDKLRKFEEVVGAVGLRNEITNRLQLLLQDAPSEEFKQKVLKIIKEI